MDYDHFRENLSPAASGTQSAKSSLLVVVVVGKRAVG
jgi:hypothetical protein